MSARIESGTAAHQPPALQPQLSILADQVDLVRHAFPDAPQRSASTMPANCAGPPRRHPRAIRQVILNIVGNAAKFTPQSGNITIKVDCTPPGLRLRVIDNGPGIPPEILRDLGQPFRSGETAYSRKYGGTGLGLYISRQLVKGHNGALEVASDLGQGTTITIDLPEESVLRAGQHSPD
jgi:signal transduction histidine kinase